MMMTKSFIIVHATIITIITTIIIITITITINLTILASRRCARPFVTGHPQFSLQAGYSHNFFNETRWSLLSALAITHHSASPLLFLPSANICLAHDCPRLPTIVYLSLVAGLPIGLPSTFLGKHGWVQYYCKTALKEASGLAHKNQQVFIVMNPIDLNQEPAILAVSHFLQTWTTLTVCWNWANLYSA